MLGSAAPGRTYPGGSEVGPSAGAGVPSPLTVHPLAFLRLAGGDVEVMLIRPGVLPVAASSQPGAIASTPAAGTVVTLLVSASATAPAGAAASLPLAATVSTAIIAAVASAQAPTTATSWSGALTSTLVLAAVAST